MGRTLTKHQTPSIELRLVSIVGLVVNTLIQHRYSVAELEIVVELGNLVLRKNLVLQKVFIGFEIFTKLNS